MKELFGQTTVNELSDSDRLASAVPGQVAAKNILFSKFWAQLKAIFGVNNWTAREYKSSPCIVVYNKAQYILDESVAPLPFNSTDFNAELIAGIWLPLAGSGGGISDHPSLTGRDALDSHPISAITGLQSALDNTVKRTDESLPTLQILTPLYNTEAVTDPRGVAPIGFHVPTNEDANLLIAHLGGNSVAGGALKSTSLTDWNTPNVGATNSSGFTAIGSGYRGQNGLDYEIKKYAFFMLTGTFNTMLVGNSNATATVQYSPKIGGTVRCIKDNNTPSIGDIIDASGNKYTEVVIGTQIWLVEDLRTTKYNNGDLIPNVTSATTWSTLTTGALCYYNNEAQPKFKHVVQTEAGDVMLVDETASGNTEVTVDNAAAYDDTTLYDKVGTVVTFSNPLSIDPQYQDPQLYQLEVALVTAGTDPEESPYDSELLTGNWRFVGQSIQTVNDNTSKVYISGSNPLGQIKSITGYKHGDTVVFSDYNTVLWFNQYAVTGASYDPAVNTYVEVFVPYDWTEPQGGWVEQCSTDRQRKFYSDAADIRVNARNYPVGGDVVDLSTKNILRLTQTGAPFTDNGTTTIIPTYKLFDVACAFVKVGELGGTVTVDATPTDGSNNPVASNGVFDALALKVDTLNQTAANVIVDATGFNGNLATTDTNQQSVNQKVDALPIFSTDSTLVVNAGIAKINLDKDRTYAPFTASSNFEIQIDQVGKKDQKTATLPLFTNGFTVTFEAGLNNQGTKTINATQQNKILFGTAANFDMYKILAQAAYVDPQLPAPTVTLTDSTESSLTFGWSDIANNVDTEVRVSQDGVTYGTWVSVGLNATSYQITGLATGSTRYLQARFLGNETTIITSAPSTAASGITATNQAPIASSVTVISTPSDFQVGNIISGSYMYTDNEANGQDASVSGSEYQLKAYDSVALANADTANISGTILSSGHTSGDSIPQLSYKLVVGDAGKSLKLWVRAKAVGGTVLGNWAGSAPSKLILTASFKSVVFGLTGSGYSDFANDPNLEFGNGTTANLPQTYFIRTKSPDVLSSDILRRGSSDSDYGLRVFNNAGYPQITLSDNSTGTNYIAVRTSTTNALDTWYGTSIAWDGVNAAGVSIFRNGSIEPLETSNSGVFSALPNGGIFTLGKNISGNNESCCLVNEIIIINKKITKAEHDELVALKEGDTSLLSFASNVKSRLRFTDTACIDLITPSRVITEYGTITRSTDKP